MRPASARRGGLPSLETVGSGARGAQADRDARLAGDLLRKRFRGEKFRLPLQEVDGKTEKELQILRMR